MHSERHVSNVNWRKVIENFRSAYQIGAPWEILIVELIANSIDAKSSKIWIEIEGHFPKLLRVIDNGKGMARGEFQDYHDLGSLTKERGGGIGWAGIGAKLYLDRCERVYTETRSTTYSGASHWSFPEDEKAPVWIDVNPRGMLRTRYGTAVEVEMSDREDCENASRSLLKNAVLASYNYAMSPIGNVVMTLNGERIAPFEPTKNGTNVKRISSRLKTRESVEGVFSLLEDEAPHGFALISVVVHGKTIGEQYDFKQFARIKDADRISGYIRCDGLIHVTTTSKDNFNKKTSLWRDFDKKMGRAFSEWLEDLGQLEKVEVDRGLDDLASEIQKDLNKIFRLPEIRELDLDLFQRFGRRLASIRDPSGEERGIETQGQQMVPGTLGGSGEGDRVPTEGEEPGSGVRTSPEGPIPTTTRPRAIRSGIQIAYVEDPARRHRAWPDPGLQAVAVNTSHPAFRCADLLGEVSFYTIDACLSVVCEVVEEEDKRSDALDKLFRGYLKVAGGA